MADAEWRVIIVSYDVIHVSHGNWIFLRLQLTKLSFFKDNLMLVKTYDKEK